MHLLLFFIIRNAKLKTLLKEFLSKHTHTHTLARTHTQLVAINELKNSKINTLGCL